MAANNISAKIIANDGVMTSERFKEFLANKSVMKALYAFGSVNEC